MIDKKFCFYFRFAEISFPFLLGDQKSLRKLSGPHCLVPDLSHCLQVDRPLDCVAVHDLLQHIVYLVELTMSILLLFVICLIFLLIILSIINVPSG